MSDVSETLVPLRGLPQTQPEKKSRPERPPWLRIKVQNTNTYNDVRKLLRELNLTTVCEDARCPNIWECWGQHKTATFMILGDTCTRACRYCSVNSGRPALPPDPEEPAHVAEAVERLDIWHAVVTSVDRDDLPDYGSQHFVDVINAIRARRPECAVEVLTPDFMGDVESLERVFAAAPEVFNHNTETVPRLFGKLRSKGVYTRVLDIFRRAHRYRTDHGITMTTKSGIMCGLGETMDELLQVMDDLREVNCDVLTFGQYLRPTNSKIHVPIDRYYHPDEFARLKEEGLSRGFAHVESGPMVRSSYHAHQHVPART